LKLNRIFEAEGIAFYPCGASLYRTLKLELKLELEREIMIMIMMGVASTQVVLALQALL
jgi:hypothetical protein